MAAYKGTTIHGFPNLFQIVGPNTALGHSSMIYIIESQVRYVVEAVKAMRHNGLGAIEPTAEAQAEWTAMVQERMKPTVWTTKSLAGDVSLRKPHSNLNSGTHRRSLSHAPSQNS